MSSVNSWLSRQLAVQRASTRIHSSSLTRLSHQQKYNSTSTPRVAGGVAGQPGFPQVRNERSLGPCYQRRRLVTSGGFGDERDFGVKSHNMGAHVRKSFDGSRNQNLHSRPKKKKGGLTRPCRPKQTPSQVLISALEHHGYNVDIPEAPKHTTDLSHADPKMLDIDNSLLLQSHRREDETPPSSITLTTILAKYILFLHDFPAILARSREGILRHENSQNEAILKVFDERTLEYLSKKGYIASDVMAWAWIVTAQRSSQAALRLWTLEDRIESSRNRVPLFVLLFTLRRRNLNAEALRILLLHTWRMLGNNQPQEMPLENGVVESSHRGSTETNHSWNLSGDESSIMILVVRLLRHARDVWPQALLSIATMMTTHIGNAARHSSDSKFNAKKIQRLTFMYNRGLKLLSVPCRRSPYRYVSIQQRAQFRLLRKMTEFSPPLAVTQEGYQAITRVQLTHKKTAAEQQWARFKAVSWPPWKEEKLGIDAERGNEGGKSRAMESMSQMVTGGYSHGNWERIATVFAGWDTDRSPTIQKRVFLPKPNAFRKHNSESEDHDLWAARIRATRTKKEAWACFLSYQDKHPPHQEVYYAMSEKIVLRERTLDELLHGEEAALPGDGKEVFPEPTSPRDVIYTGSEPPTLEALFDQMISRGIRPSRRFLAFLLAESKSFKSGMNYLQYSNLLPKEIEYLSTISSQGDKEVEAIAGDIPEYLFASFIRFLCNVSRLEKYSDESNIYFDEVFPIFCSEKSSIENSVLAGRPKRTSNPTSSRRPEALKRAAIMMKARKPRYGPAWHYFLSRLATDRISKGNHGIYLALERTLAWGEITEVLRWMDDIDLGLDIQGFQIICSAFERTVLAGRQDITGVENGLAVLAGPHKTFEGFVHAGLKLLKGRFDRLVLPEAGAINMDSNAPTSGESLIDPSYLLPNMLEVPSPASLHAFIRALGVAEDFEGLLFLLRWMTQSAPDLKMAADERLGGKRLMRRSIIAIRVFLESRWDKELPPGSRFSTADENGKEKLDGEWKEVHGAQDEGDGYSSGPIFSDPYLQEAYDIIESTRTWGPWPSDEEVASYIANWKFKKNS